AAKTTLGHLRDVQGQRRESIRRFIGLKEQWRAIGARLSSAPILHEMQKSHDIAVVTLACTKSKASLFLACAGVVDLHRLLFLAALVFVPFKHHMVVIGDL